jgi:hypothetical protein
MRQHRKINYQQEKTMDCKSLEEFDKENPNYQFLVEALQNGSIKLLEDECAALIVPPGPLHLKFGLGMKAYLDSQGYATYIAWLPENE